MEKAPTVPPPPHVAAKPRQAVEIVRPALDWLAEQGGVSGNHLLDHTYVRENQEAHERGRETVVCVCVVVAVVATTADAVVGGGGQVRGTWC